MTKNIHAVLGFLCLGITVAGCQGVPGLLGGPPDGDSPYASGGLVANNAASLGGQVFAPSSLVANNSASLIGNNSASLIGNNSASLVSNNAAAYRTASIQELPVFKAEVKAIQNGQVVATTTTDETGRYTLPGLTKEKAYLLQVSFTLDVDGHNQKYQELAIAKTLNQQSESSVNSASTLVTAKILTQNTSLEQVNQAKYNDTVNLVAAAQTSIERSALTSTQASSDAFDQVRLSSDQVANTFTEALSSNNTTSNGSPDQTDNTQVTSYDPREYFFPPSAAAEGEFLTTITTVNPQSSGLGTQVSTSSFVAKVANYTTNSATLQRTIEGGDSQLQILGGQVKMDNMTMGTPVFSTEGMTVTPLGASDTVRYSLMAANQQVTVKAGIYTCVKLLETTNPGQGQSQRTLWYAKGIGVGPVKVLTNWTVSTPSGTATKSIETVLTSFKH